jgi:solute carrier family 35 protein F5
LSLGKLVGVEEMTRTKVFAVLARSVWFRMFLSSEPVIYACLVNRGPLRCVKGQQREQVMLTSSFLGVVLVTKSDSSISPASSDNLPTQPLLGDFFALLSAGMYAVYVILMKVAIGDEERADMRLLLGCVTFTL